MSRQAIVIGGGVNGLAAAIRLADRGASVVLLEARDEVGGRAAGESFAPGHQTTGTLHDTARVPRWVIQQLGLHKHGLTQVPEPAVVGVGRAGQTLVLPSSIEAAAASLDGVQVSLGRKWRRWRDEVAVVGRALSALSASGPPDIGQSASMWSLMGPAMSALKLGRGRLIDLTRVAPLCAQDWLDEWFDHPLLQSTLSLPALQETWMGPRSPTSAMALLLHHGLAGDEIAGGPAGLVAALVRAAAARKIEVRTGTKVIRISADGGLVVHLSDGSSLSSEHVVSTLGVQRTLLNLFEPRQLPMSVGHAAGCVRSRGIVAKIDMTLSAPLPVPGHQSTPYSRIRVAPDNVYLERAFDDAKHRRMPASPALDIRIPSLEQADLAPEGGHVASVLAYGVAGDLEGGWTDAARDALGRVVTETISDFLPGSADCILQTRVRTPVDLDADLGLDGGHLFHAELGLDQMLSFRPHPALAHYTTPIAGLVLGGSAMHPAGGLMGAAGILAADSAF